MSDSAETITNPPEWPEWDHETAEDDAPGECPQPADPVGEYGDLNPDEVSAAAEPPDPLSGLRGVERVHVFRRKPTWCKGLLCSLDLAEDEEIDLGQLKQDWGGGQILLRPLHHTAGGWKYKRGAVSVQFTGPPRERGMPLGRDGDPRIIETSARPVVEPPARGLVRQTGGDGMAVIAQLFDRIVDRLDRLEARVAVPAPAPVPHDPLAEVKRAGLMVRELRQLAGVFSGEQSEEPEGDEDEENEEDEEEGPPSPEAMLMRLLEKKLDEGDKPAEAPQSKTGPRLIRASASASTRPKQPPTPAAQPVEVVEAEPEAEHEAEPIDVEAVVSGPDPWTETVAPELRGAPASVAAAAAPILEQLRALPTDQAMELLDGVVRSLPKEQVIGWIQAMQQAK